MKIILLQDIKKLGRRLDSKDVADGYAIHFLFKNKLAMPATPENTARRAELIAREETTRKKIGQDAQRLQKEECIFTLKTGAHGEVFNSITKNDIKKMLEEKGYASIKEIALEKPIRNAGTYQTVVHLKQGIQASITIIATCG